MVKRGHIANSPRHFSHGFSAHLHGSDLSFPGAEIVAFHPGHIYHWLVGQGHPSEKYDFVNFGMMNATQYEWEHFPRMATKPPTSYHVPYTSSIQDIFQDSNHSQATKMAPAPAPAFVIPGSSESCRTSVPKTTIASWFTKRWRHSAWMSKR